MAYTIKAGETKAIIDQNGDPVPAAGTTSVGGALPPYGPGLAATITDVDGFLVCTGNTPTETGVTFSLTRQGTTADHTVTVTPGEFDWTLG